MPIRGKEMVFPHGSEAFIEGTLKFEAEPTNERELGAEPCLTFSKVAQREKVIDMNEKELTELGLKIFKKQIELAKLKGNKGHVGDIVRHDGELITLKKQFNQEIDKLSKAEIVKIVGSE